MGNTPVGKNLLTLAKQGKNNDIYKDNDLKTVTNDDIIVNVTKSVARLVLSKDQLKTAIKACYSGQAQKNLLDALDAFYSIQQNYKVNGTTESEFNEWIKSIPIKIYYPLATPTEETITFPELTLPDSNTALILTETSVPASNIKAVTYR